MSDLNLILEKKILINDCDDIFVVVSGSLVHMCTYIQYAMQKLKSHETATLTWDFVME